MGEEEAARDKGREGIMQASQRKIQKYSLGA